MFIITWSEKILLNHHETEQHKAITCSKKSASSLFSVLTKDIFVVEASVKDDAGNLVPGGFFQKA